MRATLADCTLAGDRIACSSYRPRFIIETGLKADKLA
jgi:hypothetical protein